jgi:hypothetical protein
VSSFHAVDARTDSAATAVAARRRIFDANSRVARRCGKANAMGSRMIAVLDPTAPAPQAAARPTRRLFSLAGKVLGIRRDRVWQSFTHFSDHIAALARTRWHVRDVVFFDPGVRIGTTDEERQKVAGFVRAVDAAIVGLGT